MKLRMLGLSVLCVILLFAGLGVMAQEANQPAEPQTDGVVYQKMPRARSFWYRLPRTGMPVFPRRAPVYAPIQLQCDACDVPADSQEEALPEAPAAEDTVVETAPVEEAPAVEAAPVEEAPAVEAAPVEEGPAVEAAPVEETPAVEAAPVEEAPAVEATPVEEGPAVEAAPVEEAPAVEAAPVEEAPAVEVAPVEEAPAVEAAPVNDAQVSEEQNKETTAMNVTSAPFGQTKEGTPVTAWTLKNANGLTAVILDFGGVLYEMNTPDKNGQFANISCNYATVPEYQDIRPYFGSLVGRFGNRIAKGQFTIDGNTYQVPVNNGENALHGGLQGFDQKIWAVEPFTKENSVGLKLTYSAADGEEGYPGKLDVTVLYELTNANQLIIDYTAVTDKATPINLTNHTFWNLGGATSGSILGTELKLGAVAYLPTDDGLIPTGEIATVEGTPLDFRTAKTIGQDIAWITEPQFNGGYDHCLILDQKNPGEMTFCALARDPNSGRTMEITTTEPAVQFYSGNFLDGTTGVGDYKYEKQYAFCLETQHYPDSPNHPEFPTTILQPGETYRHTTVHTFGVQ